MNNVTTISAKRGLRARLRALIILGILGIGLAGGGALLWRFFTADFVKPVPALWTDANSSEQILFDELDFHDHPSFLGDTYPAFAPERLRQQNSAYFFRTDAASSDAGHSGKSYGEIVLKASTGGIMYLPRAVTFNDALGISFRYKKTEPTARCYLRIWKNGALAATVLEGRHERFPFLSDSGWHTVQLPWSELRFASRRLFPEQEDFKDPMSNLRYHSVGADEIFAIELGLQKSKPGEKLFIDRLALLQPVRSDRLLRGSVVPPQVGLSVFVNTPVQRLTATTDSEGKFAIEIPPGAPRYEVMTQHEGIWYLPEAGRYFEAGSFIPPVRIVLRNERPAAFAGKALYWPWAASEDRGVHWKPNADFIYCAHLDEGKQEFLTENRVNSSGFVDKERRLENPDGAFRVVYNGECIITGVQVDCDDHVCSQIESTLRFRGHRPVEVMSMAHNLYALTGGWLPIRELGLKWQPNLILINVAAPESFHYLIPELNAVEFGYDPEHPPRDDMDIDPKTGKLTSVPYDSTWELYRVNAPKRSAVDGGPNVMAGVHWLNDFCREDPNTMPPLAKRAVRIFRETLRVCVQEAKKQNCDVALVLCSPIGSIKCDRWEKDGVQYDMKRFPALIREIAADVGADVIDVMPHAMEKARDGKGRLIMAWPRAGHWSPAGHGFVAEALADYIEQRYSGQLREMTAK